MKPKLIRTLVILAIILLVVIGIGARINHALHRPPPPPRTVLTRTGDITIQVSETGTIQPANKVDIKSKVAGRLLTIPIQEGQYVTRGQLIATVDRTLIDPQIASVQAQLSQAEARLQQSVAEYNLQRAQTQSAIAQAQAGVDTASAHLAAVEAGARPQELAQAQQAVARAQITLDDARRTQRRKEALLAKGFISQADADTSQVSVDTAASALASAQQQLALTQAGPRIQDINDAKTQVEAARVQLASARANAGQNEVRKSDIAQSQANVQQIRNQLAQLTVSLSDTRIIAPASGIVLKKYKEVNEIVQSATTGFSDTQSLVATLGSRLLVQVGINEVDIPKVHLSSPVTIHVDALPDTAFSGVVTEIAPATTNAFADASSGAGGQSAIAKFSVKIAFAKYDSRLRPGMSAGVDILSARHSNVVLAPLEAIPFTGNHGTVTVLTIAGSQEKRPVTLGLRSDTAAEVLTGLRPGEKLVVAPINGKDRRKIDITDDNG